MKARARVAVGVVAGALVTTAAYAVTASAEGGRVLGPGTVTLDVGIQHSRFSIGKLRVQEGTMVRFVVQNDDPINHELVVGTDEVHRAHREGTERQHPPVPGEISVEPGERGFTFTIFDEAGTVEYVCHLPGHEAFGMRGEIEVVPAS